MQCVTAPGLPPWPPLLFDPIERNAVVSARHPTWRSEEWASRAAEICVWIGVGASVWLSWDMTAGWDPVARVLVCMTAGGVFFPIACLISHGAIAGFLARRLFATKSVVSFSEEAIVIHSRIYPRPVVLWRIWRGRPVRGRFVFHQDREALSYANRQRERRKTPKDHMSDAMTVHVVLTSVGRQGGLMAGDRENVLRSVPVTEVCGRFARAFTMVYTAAMILTSPKQQTPPGNTKDGVDIDAA